MPIPPQFSGVFLRFNPPATTSAKSRKRHPARHAHRASSARSIEIPYLFVRGVRDSRTRLLPHANANDDSVPSNDEEEAHEAQRNSS
jgi:hypothetical protein